MQVHCLILKIICELNDFSYSTALEHLSQWIQHIPPTYYSLQILFLLLKARILLYSYQVNENPPSVPLYCGYYHRFFKMTIYPHFTRSIPLLMRIRFLLQWNKLLYTWWVFFSVYITVKTVQSRVQRNGFQLWIKQLEPQVNSILRL